MELNFMSRYKYNNVGPATGFLGSEINWPWIIIIRKEDVFLENSTFPTKTSGVSLEGRKLLSLYPPFEVSAKYYLKKN